MCVHVYVYNRVSVIKNDDILPFDTTWMDLQSSILSEISQTQKDKYYDFTYMWTLKTNKQSRNRIEDTENRCLPEGRRWEEERNS